MASYSFLTKSDPVRSTAYQQYLDEQNNIVNTLVGLCAGKPNLYRLQREQTLKYFQSLSGQDETREEEQVKVCLHMIGSRRVS